jgi:FKBP12-rapamycin complex-associated protein
MKPTITTAALQMFGLVNTLLGADRETNKQDLHIQRCSVIPLSPNSGLIECVFG